MPMTKEEKELIAKQAARFRDLYRQADEAAAPILAEVDETFAKLEEELAEEINSSEPPHRSDDERR